MRLSFRAGLTLASATPRRAWCGRFERTTVAAGNEDILQHWNLTNTADQRLPPLHVQGAADAFVAILWYRDGPRRVLFNLSLDAATSGSPAGPQLTDTAESNLAIIAQANDGTVFGVRISDEIADDTEEPYSWTITGRDGGV